MPFSGIRIVLNEDLIASAPSDFRAAARKAFPGAILEQRPGQGTQAPIVDVLEISLVNGESVMVSKGAEEAAEFSRILMSGLDPLRE